LKINKKIVFISFKKAVLSPPGRGLTCQSYGFIRTKKTSRQLVDIMKEFFTNPPRIIADNGAVPGLPPGSIEAVEKAFEMGADCVFLTIRLTADRVPLVAIDPEVAGPHGEELIVAESELAAIMKGDAAYYYPDREGTSFPLRNRGITYCSLKDMFFRFPERKFVLDLADTSDVLTEEVLKLLSEYNSTNRIIISSVNAGTLKKIRKKMPAVATTLSSMSIIGAYFLYRAGLLSLKKNFAGDAMFIPESIGLSYMGNRVLLQEMKKRKKAVYVWNVKTEQEMSRLTDIHIDGFITNSLQELLKLLENRDQ